MRISLLLPFGALLTLPFLMVNSSDGSPDRDLAIDELSVVEESSLEEEAYYDLMKTSGTSAMTYPSLVTAGNTPMYTSGTFPNLVNRGDNPGGLTSGTFPSSYTNGFRIESHDAQGTFPEPLLEDE